MTQGDLAEAVGVTRQTIGLIEVESTTQPSHALPFARHWTGTLINCFGRIRKEVKMMKFKLINNEVTDEREEALTNKANANAIT